MFDFKYRDTIDPQVLYRMTLGELFEMGTAQADEEINDRGICSACGEPHDEPGVNHNNAECSSGLCGFLPDHLDDPKFNAQYPSPHLDHSE